jgi:anti-sigma factor RsiW
MKHDEPKATDEPRVDLRSAARPGAARPGAELPAEGCRCPDAETLFFYGEGLLEPEESRIVAAHVAGCKTCRERHHLDMELTVSLRRLPLPEPSPTVLEAVRNRIQFEGRRHISPWWWIAAASFIVASGLRWLLVADLSFQGAAMAAFDLLLFVVRSPLVLFAWLTDAETWADAALVAQSLVGALTSSPVGIVFLTMAALAVVAATNLALFGAARRMMRS